MDFSLQEKQIGLCLVDNNLLNSIISDLRTLLTSRIDIVPVSIAAEMLGISATAVRYRIKTGKLDAVPVNFNSGVFDDSTKEAKVVLYVKTGSLYTLMNELKKGNKQKPGPKSKQAQCSNH